MYQSLKQRFHQVIPHAVDFCSLRYIDEHSEQLQVRQNVLQPLEYKRDKGVMLTIIDKDGAGYAATSDLSTSGLRSAMQQAQQWAQRSQGHSVVDFSKITMPHNRGNYASHIEKSWNDISITDKIDLLQQESVQSKLNDKIVDWNASLWSIQTEQAYFTNDGGEIYQNNQSLIPNISVTAHQGIDSQRRSLGGHMAYGRQGGLELLQQIGFIGKGREIAEEALQLLAAPNCPTECMDLVLDSDQMILQIHESIGHPLELDRILGDERNYAGTSFVTLDLFGHYQYGSPLLNVTYDPSYPEQLASYGFDDEGLPATRTYLIRNGILVAPLGGLISQARTGLPGVANSRVSHWNRPPIDRMANLNVEPGNSSFAGIISEIERGIFMKSNISWSIDDSRNKFQFGCEWGQLIENGQLTQVVKNPNYRGISATFWRSLKKVGNKDTFNVLGVAFCGKGEPNQVIKVGHAAPVCLFNAVDVFGGV